MNFKNLMSQSKFILGIVIGLTLAGGAAFSATIFNTPATGYLLCVNQKTKVVTYPATQKCPSGSSKLIIGAQGPEGLQGEPGVQGPEGQAGPAGIEGKPGIQGERGEAGPQGIRGETGATGEQGIAGENGADGKNGLDGKDGKDGLTPACDRDGQTVLLSGYKYTCITSAAGGYVWNKGIPIQPLPTPNPTPTPTPNPTPNPTPTP
jgi:hypothetical protein